MLADVGEREGTDGMAAPAVRVRDGATVERVQLDAGSWVDVSRGWLEGADDLYEHLLREVAWRSSSLFRYEVFVDERRLGASWSRGRPLPHPALGPITRWIQKRYGVLFDGFGMIQYRDGTDGQGFHRDTDMRWLEDTVIAVLTLGATRPWRLRPHADRRSDDPTKGATHELLPAAGDLLVMGGRCQADWQHSVPYVPSSPVGPRISLQWRAVRTKGEPFHGASYRAPVSYGNARRAQHRS